MRQITYMLAALSLAGPSAAASGQEIRYSGASPAVTIASSFGGSSSAKLGLSVSSGSERDTLGLLVVRIESGGPAEKAGIVEGDRLMSVNGTPLTLSAADAGEPDMALILRRRLERTLEPVEPEQEVSLRVWSGGRIREVKVRTGEERRASRVAEVHGSYALTSTRMSGDRPVIGVSLGGTGSKRDTLGVFISAVVEGGPAEQAGIIEGYRIASVNGVDLRVPAADAGDPMVASARANRLQRELEKVEPGARVQLRVWSDGRYRDVTVEAKRQSDVYKDGRGVRIGGMGVLNSIGPSVIFRGSPSVITLEPVRERIESLDSLWRRREEIRRSVDPRFQRDTSGSAGSGSGGIYHFRMDDTIREAMERARLEMERARQRYVPGMVIRTWT